MSRVHKPHRWQWLWLIPAALLVWWPLWFLFMGALMSQEELRLTIGPALGLGTGYTVWAPVARLADARTVADPAVGTPQFFVMFWNSIGQSVAQVAGNLLVGAPAAWAISRLRFRGRSMVRGLYIVLMLLPFQVTMVPSYLILRQFGLLDTPWPSFYRASFLHFRYLSWSAALTRFREKSWSPLRSMVQINGSVFGASGFHWGFPVLYPP